MSSLKKLHKDIVSDQDNAWAREKNWQPLYSAHPDARIVIIGQAPGRLAQESGIAWNDPSGRNLRAWMGVDEAVFYDAKRIAIIPMDFYFPGSAAQGDHPPRKDFARKWHGLILPHMRHVKLTLLIGRYAQNHYLNGKQKRNLTETVRAYESYLPQFLPLVHPSPRNNIWQKKNPWFAKNLLPALKAHIADILR